MLATQLHAAWLTRSTSCLLYPFLCSVCARLLAPNRPAAGQVHCEAQPQAVARRDAGHCRSASTEVQAHLQVGISPPAAAAAALVGMNGDLHESTTHCFVEHLELLPCMPGPCADEVANSHCHTTHPEWLQCCVMLSHCLCDSPLCDCRLCDLQCDRQAG